MRTEYLTYIVQFKEDQWSRTSNNTSFWELHLIDYYRHIQFPVYSNSTQYISYKKELYVDLRDIVGVGNRLYKPTIEHKWLKLPNYDCKKVTPFTMKRTI